MLQCSSCNIRLGKLTSTDHFELFKWAVALRSIEKLPWQALPLQIVVSAQLLTLIEDQAVRRFFVRSDELGKKSPALMVQLCCSSLVQL